MNECFIFFSLERENANETRTPHHCYQLKERELEFEQTIRKSRGIKGIKTKCEQEEKERTS